jgi:hypothetical protein
MVAVSTSETSVNFYQTTRRNNPEDRHLRSYIFFKPGVPRCSHDYPHYYEKQPRNMSHFVKEVSSKPDPPWIRPEVLWHKPTLTSCSAWISPLLTVRTGLHFYLPCVYFFPCGQQLMDYSTSIYTLHNSSTQHNLPGLLLYVCHCRKGFQSATWRGEVTMRFSRIQQEKWTIKQHQPLWEAYFYHKKEEHNLGIKSVEQYCKICVNDGTFSVCLLFLWNYNSLLINQLTHCRLV